MTDDLIAVVWTILAFVTAAAAGAAFWAKVVAPWWARREDTREVRARFDRITKEW
jgi:hypothetical protein